MNLFCFSLEGSLDSLYEAVQESSGSSSPVPLSEPWRTSGRSVSVDMSQIYREKQRSSTPKSVSETGGLADHSICAHSSRHVAIKQEALVPRNNQNEDAVTESKTVEQRQIETRNTQARCSGASTLDHSHTHHRKTGTTVKAATTQRRPANEKQDMSFHRQSLKQQPVGHINSAKGTTAEAAVGSSQRSKISERPAHSRSRWSGPPEKAPHRATGRASPAEQLRSTTSLDFCASDRSTSFGRVDALRHQPSPSRLDESEKTEAERESISENEKLGSLGKKMKTISLTMRKRIGKKHVLSEDVANDTERETETGFAVEKKQQQSSNSSESLYSGQSSSSGVLSSDASSYKDELSTLQFCGRARAHTDFVPSPYDTDSLKLKVGDIINIISKPPMGIWTGMLENKVGNFKFIYVDVLPEKELEEEETPKIRTMKVCKKPRPNTLLELLERLHLEEYASSLLLNGYQTVDDLKHLKERHLIELNVTDPEDRRRLLAASDCLYVSGKEDNTLMKVDEEEGCPRDSGCFIPAECTDC